MPEAHSPPSLEDLVPAAVACAVSLTDTPSAFLYPEEARQLGSDAVEARVREFASGRACARQALGKLGLPVGPILVGRRREPLWPPGVVGSITHCAGYRAAAVARATDVLTIGIDAEVHEALPPGVGDIVLVDEEQTWLSSAAEGIHWDRVLFSMKESVFKAWFSLTSTWLDFEDAVVTPDVAHGTCDVRLHSAAQDAGDRGPSVFTGRFAVQGSFVLTAVVEARRPPMPVVPERDGHHRRSA